MNHHSSYSAPRSSRTSGSGMPGGRRNKSAKRNTYNTQSWKDNPILRNLVFFVLPFAVINIILFVLITASPKIELTLGETTDYKTVGVSFKVKSILPVKDVTVTLESQPLETERSDGAYQAVLTTNGTLEVYVESWNGMTARHNEHIAVLDDAAPTIDQEDYVLEDGHLEILVSDSQSGIDFGSIYGSAPTGETIRPTSCDEGTGRVTFDMEGSELNVFVSDYAGNVSQASFSIHTNGIDTENRESLFSEEEDESSSSRSSETTKAKETTKASETTKAKETTKASETTKAKETTKASETTKAKETTKASETTKAQETTKASETTKAQETTKAPESSQSQETSPAPSQTEGGQSAPSAPETSPASQESGETITIIPLG